jgi:hypothetical protein
MGSTICCMTDNDNYRHPELSPPLYDQQVNEEGETGWPREARPVDPDIEKADHRQLPSGHIAFAGAAILERYTPRL